MGHQQKLIIITKGLHVNLTRLLIRIINSHLKKKKNMKNSRLLTFQLASNLKFIKRKIEMGEHLMRRISFPVY